MAGIARVVPGPGQESVWDYPRPPRVEGVPERLLVVVDGEVFAETTHGLRVLETAGAPVSYFQSDNVRAEVLRASPKTTVREWKGVASYHRYIGPNGRTIEDVAWSYPDPTAGYEAIAGHLVFYAGPVDEAWVGDERAARQPGGFHGGWVTSRIVGPIKGAPASFGW